MARRTLAISILFGISTVAGPALGQAAAEPFPAGLGTIEGIVRDDLGAAIERALVLLTPVGAQGLVRSTVTGAEGKYHFEEVPLGLYRVTAVRAGYISAFARIQSWGRRSLDLVLAPEGSSPPRPSGSAWVLAAPRRDVLRDLDFAAPEDVAVTPPGEGEGAAVPSSAGGALAALGSTFEGELGGSLSEARPGPSAGSDADGGTGSVASLKLGSAAGPRGRWTLEGERARESLSWGDDPVSERMVTERRLRLDLGWQTGVAGQLDMRAYFEQGSRLYEMAAGGPDPLPGFSEAEQTRAAWGYDAGWSGSIGGHSVLDADLRYAGNSLGAAPELDPRRSSSARFDGLDDPSPRSDVVGTRARLTRQSGSHSMRVGVGARVYSYGTGRLTRIYPSPFQDPLLFSHPGMEGWTVGVSAGESWEVAEALSVDYGVDLSRTVAAGAVARQAVVPQVGLVLAAAPSMSVRWTVFHSGLVSEMRPLGAIEPTAAGRQAQSLGYRFEVDGEVGKRLRLQIGCEARPWVEDAAGAAWSPRSTPGPTGLYLTSGVASVREVHGLVSVRPAAWGTVELSGGLGTVAGDLAASIPESGYLRELQTGTVRYRTARLSGRVERTGTTVLVEVGELSQVPVEGATGTSYGDRRSTIQVLQTLGFFRPGSTDWIVQIGWSAYEPDLESTSPSEGLIDPALATPMTRLTGGLAVKF